MNPTRIVVAIAIALIGTAFYFGTLVAPQQNFDPVKKGQVALLLAIAVYTVIALFSRGQKDDGPKGPKVVTTKSHFHQGFGLELPTIRSLKLGKVYNVVDILGVDSQDRSMKIVLEDESGHRDTYWLSNLQAAWVQPSAGGTQDRLSAAGLLNLANKVLVAKSGKDWLLIPQGQVATGSLPTMKAPTPEELARMKAELVAQQAAAASKKTGAITVIPNQGGSEPLLA